MWYFDWYQIAPMFEVFFSSSEPLSSLVSLASVILMCVCVVNIFKHFLLWNHWADWEIETKFHMEPPWDGGTKVCSSGWGHMTKMAAMPIHGKTLKIFFSGTERPMTLKLGMQHWVQEYYQFYSNNDPGLTLTYFMARSNLVPYAFVWEKGKTMDFSETVIVYDDKVGICS